MRVTFLGTGAAMPHPERVQTGLLVETAAGDRRPVLVDCGAGVLHRLSQTDPGYEAVGTVLLTHHHLDHVADLLPLVKARWLAGEESLTVVGPPGTKGLVDELLAVHDYLEGRIDLRLREVHPDTTFEVGGLRVSARETRHSVQCLAYRFEPQGDAGHDGEAATQPTETGADSETGAESAGGAEPAAGSRSATGEGSATGDGSVTGSRSAAGDPSATHDDTRTDAETAHDERGGAFVFSGDSEAFEGLASFADGARVLAHDCSFPNGIDVDNHPTPRQLGEALAGHDVDRVYLTHAYPHTDGKESEMIDSVQAAFDGDVRMARDGLRFRV